MSKTKRPARAAARETPAPETTNREEFLATASLLMQSGVGVVVARTRELVRCAGSIAEFVGAQGDHPLAEWDVVRGWRRFQDPSNPDAEPEVVPGSNDPFAALKMVGGAGGGDRWPDGVYIMHHLHRFLEDPRIVQCLKLYVAEFPLRHQRLFVICPEGFQLPPELQNDVPVVEFDLPDRAELAETLEAVAAASFPAGRAVPLGELFSDAERASLIGSAQGMTVLEAEVAFSKAVISQRARFTSGDPDFRGFNRTVLDTKTEVVKRSEVLELHPTIPADQIGGLDLIKAYLEARKRAFTDEARAFGADRPKGILAVGRPGTGKSLLAQVAGDMLGVPLIRWDLSRVFGKYVGDSERATRSTLGLLRSLSPCVCWVDEIDKLLGGSASDESSGVTKRLLSALLTFMQECREDIYFIFTANRVSGLPPELLRKGRVDECFHVAPPNRRERAEVFAVHLHKRNHDWEDFQPADRAALLDASEGYTGAEIEAAVAEAIMAAFSGGHPAACPDEIARQFGTMKGVAEAFPEECREMEAWARANAKPASSPEAKRKVPAKKAARRRVL